MSVSLHFTAYFPNVSYVNSKRPRMEDCSNEGEKKQGRRQEEKEGKLKTVKTGEERGQRMEGRESGRKKFHLNSWFEVAKR